MSKGRGVFCFPLGLNANPGPGREDKVASSKRRKVKRGRRPAEAGYASQAAQQVCSSLPIPEARTGGAPAESRHRTPGKAQHARELPQRPFPGPLPDCRRANCRLPTTDQRPGEEGGSDGRIGGRVSESSLARQVGRIRSAPPKLQPQQGPRPARPPPDISASLQPRRGHPTGTRSPPASPKTQTRLLHLLP